MDYLIQINSSIEINYPQVIDYYCRDYIWQK